MAQLLWAGASVAVASALTVCAPKPSTCMNQGMIPVSAIVQRTYLEVPGGCAAAVDVGRSERHGIERAIR